MNLKDFIARPGSRIRLDAFPTDHTRGISDKTAAERRLQKNVETLADQQERL